MRRIIFCHMTPPTFRQVKYEPRLWDEAKHFIWKCIKGYRERYPEFMAIKADRKEVEELADQRQEFNHMFFMRFFIEKPIKSKDRECDHPYVSASRVQSVMMQAKLTPAEKRSFLKYLRDYRGFINKPVNLDDGEHTERRWLGFENTPGAKNTVDIAMGRI